MAENAISIKTVHSLQQQLDEYLDRCREERVNSQMNPSAAHEFIDLLYFDKRLSSFSWYTVSQEEFSLKNTDKKQKCSLYALGVTEELNPAVFVDKFVELALNQAEQKNIYIYMPVVMSSSISEQGDVTGPLYATWVSFI